MNLRYHIEQSIVHPYWWRNFAIRFYWKIPIFYWEPENKLSGESAWYLKLTHRYAVTFVCRLYPYEWINPIYLMYWNKILR